MISLKRQKGSSVINVEILVITLKYSQRLFWFYIRGTFKFQNHNLNYQFKIKTKQRKKAAHFSVSERMGKQKYVLSFSSSSLKYKKEGLLKSDTNQ